MPELLTPSISPTSSSAKINNLHNDVEHRYDKFVDNLWTNDVAGR